MLDPYVSPPISAKVVQVIAVVGSRGDGSEEDPHRVVYQYFSLEGELLACYDEINGPPDSFRLLKKPAVDDAAKEPDPILDMQEASSYVGDPAYAGDDYPREGFRAAIEVEKDRYFLGIFAPDGKLFDVYPPVDTPHEISRMIDEWLYGCPKRPEHRLDQFLDKS